MEWLVDPLEIISAILDEIGWGRPKSGSSFSSDCLEAIFSAGLLSSTCSAGVQLVDLSTDETVGGQRWSRECKSERMRYLVSHECTCDADFLLASCLTMLDSYTADRLKQQKD